MSEVIISDQTKSVLVILIIPSHRKNKKQISEKIRDSWREDAQTLFAKLYGGSTAFAAVAGSYWSAEQKEVLWDCPISVEAYVNLSETQLYASFEELQAFARKMRDQLQQESVMIVIDNHTYFIEN